MGFQADGSASQQAETLWAKSSAAAAAAASTLRGNEGGGPMPLGSTIYSTKHMNQTVDQRERKRERGTVRVMATMWQIYDHAGDSGSVIHGERLAKEKLARAILTVAPNSNQMGSRVAITGASIVTDYRKYT